VSRKFTRRRFLETALAGPVVIGASAVAEEAQKQPASPRSVAVSRKSVRAVIDEIIPAGDGMPSASEAGGLEYLERVSARESEFAAEMERALEALERLSERRFHMTLAQLPSPRRVEILTALERQSPAEFAKLRDHVYESYYTQPRIWKLIGYRFYPTDQPGPSMKPFDESVLAKVRRTPKLYREAG
jgi:hypothetical protein